MERIVAAACLATLLLAGQASGAEQAGKAQAAERKAEVLEKKAAGEATPAQPITRPEAQAVDPHGEKPLDDPITCLARTIYWEARSEDETGMQAIADVVMNRLGHEGFPNTVCGIVRQGKEQGACQFSWWCDGRPDDAEEEGRYAIAKEIARKALNRQLADLTHGALYFHHKGSTPSWAKDYIKTAGVGEHVFYKPAGGEAK